MYDQIKTITCSTPWLVARIYQDPHPPSPAEWDNLGEIAYLSKSREVLGTKAVSVEQMDEIGRKVRDGEYIGIPVWAYVHSGATIQAAWENPFSCPWDSGRSGWVYTTREKVLKEYGRKRMSPELRAKVHEILRGEVETFDQYLQGDVYGYEIVDTRDAEVIESCWGVYGHDDVVQEAERVLLEVEKARNAQLCLRLEE